MTPKQLKNIAKAAMVAAHDMAIQKTSYQVIEDLKDTSKSFESIIDEYFDCKTPEQYDFVMSELKKGREEYLKTGKITLTK